MSASLIPISTRRWCGVLSGRTGARSAAAWLMVARQLAQLSPQPGGRDEFFVPLHVPKLPAAVRRPSDDPLGLADCRLWRVSRN